MIFNKKKIQDFLNTNNTSIRKIEDKAGVSRNAIHNILSDRSKNPSLESIIKIADVLNCTVDELLGRENILPNYTNNKETSNFYYDQQLVQNIINFINEYLKNNDIKNVKIADFLYWLEKIYDYSFSNNNQLLDTKFADWFIKKMHATL